MGAESSSLQAIESLNETLSGIERKLGVIEDVHLHHERTICHDNINLISGKQIVSNPGISLSVGPIIGLLTQHSVRVLLETDVDVELSLNFFLKDENHTEARFFRTEKLEARACTPIAKTFTEFRANTNYVLYIGGCSSRDTLLNYACFRTLPSSESTTLCPKILLTHSGRIDRIIPGEVNLWNDVDQRISIDHVGSTSSPNSLSKEEDSGPVHMAVHLGNFIDIDPLMRSRAIELLDMIVREDIGVEGWDKLLQDTEELVRDAYRRAFNAPESKTMLRRCAHIFVAGDAEAAMVTSSLLGMAPETPFEDAFLRKDEEEKEAQEQEQSKKKMSMKEKRAAEKLEAKMKAEAEAKANRKLARGEEDPDELPIETADDLEVPSAAGALRRQRAVTKDQLTAETGIQEELRRLLLGAIVRLVRRVNWSYMRQLWDDNFETLMAEEERVEATQRAILKTRKRLQIQAMLLSNLKVSHKKTVKEFGEQYKASFFLASRVESIEATVEKLQAELRVQLDDSAYIIANLKEPINGLCKDLGGIVLVLLESAWGWLGKDGLAQNLYNREIPIHPSLSETLETVLYEGRQKDNEYNEEVRTVLCASGCQLLPYREEPEILPATHPQPFVYVSADSGRLMKMIALWQQRRPERATLIASPCPLFAADGWVFPIMDEAEDGGGNAESEGWNGDRCKMRYILVGKMDKQCRARGATRYDASDVAPPTVALRDEKAEFQVKFNLGSAVSRRSFWSATSRAATKPQKKGDTDKWIIGRDANFQLDCVSDRRQQVEVCMGPIVGKVTPRSAIILLETTSACHVELLCVDQLTGIEHSSSQLMHARCPTAFRFDELVPHRSYDIRLATESAEHSTSATSKRVSITDQAVLTVRGSFTTPERHSWTIDEATEKQAALKLRERAHNYDNNRQGEQILGEGKRGGSIEEKRGDGGDRPAVALTALVVGSNKPSWLRVLPYMDAEGVDEASLGNDREFLSTGLNMIQRITDLTSRSLSRIDLVIHCGYSVDLSVVMQSVVSLIARAEESSILMDSRRMESSLKEAFSVLRNAYSLHWGASSTRQLLGHGSHLIVSSPMTDLLTAFNASTLKQLSRELSVFSTRHLLHMVTKLDLEYQGVLWGEGVNLPNSDGHYRNQHRAHFLAGGSVAIFPLSLQVLHAQDSFGTAEDGLLSEFLFDALGSLLGQNVVGSAANNQEQEVSTLVIVSPLPIVHDDPLLVEGTFLSASVRGLVYSPTETLRLLDILSAWVEMDRSRQVLLVTGGVDIGQCTSIYAQVLDAPAGGGGREEDDVLYEVQAGSPATAAGAGDEDGDVIEGKSRKASIAPKLKKTPTFAAGLKGSKKRNSVDIAMNMSSSPQHYIQEDSASQSDDAGGGTAAGGGGMNYEPVVIRQLSVGPLVGVPGDVRPAKEGQIFSSSRRFSYEHDYLSQEPHCGLVEIRPPSKQSMYNEVAIELVEYLSLESILSSSSEEVVSSKEKVVLKKDLIEDSDVALLWKHTNAHLTGNRKKKSSVPQNDDALALSYVVNMSLDSEEVMRLYEPIHQGVLRDGVLPLPLTGGTSVEDSILAAARFFLHLMPAKYKAVCPMPSSLTVRLVWNSLIKTEAKVQKKASTTDDPEIDARHMVVAALSADPGYLAYILRRCVEAQALLEHFSSVFSTQDGLD